MGESGSLIGKWVTRTGLRTHFVESEVADSVITTCGKRLKRQGPHNSEMRVVESPAYIQICWAGCVAKYAN